MPRLPARASIGATPEFNSTLSMRARALFSNAQARVRGGHTLCSHAASTKLLVLDMDGVLVDSEPEVSEAGVRAARMMWPAAFPEDVHLALKTLKLDMRKLRPVLVDGYETMMMARMLQAGARVDALAADWPAEFATGCKTYGTSAAVLEPYLESFRRKWMAESPAEYLAANAPYPGVVKSLQRCPHQLYIASSKKENRVARLATNLLHLDGFGAGSAWLFAGLLPPNEEKARVLQALAQECKCNDVAAKPHFVDDRAETLLYMAQQPQLQMWTLHFASWGYSTDADKDAIARQERIQHLTLPEFCTLLDQ